MSRSTGRTDSLLTRALLLVLLIFLPSCGPEGTEGEGSATSAPRSELAAVVDGPIGAFGSDVEVASIDAAGRDLAERRVMDAYDRVAPSVVTVTTTVLQMSFFFEVVPSEGAGSGFVVDREGHVLTNHHVIQGARRIEVTFADGTTAEARVVGVDTVNDVALLKVDPGGMDLVPVEFGSSADLKVGQRAIAIGNPFGQFGQSLTTGVVSALDRTLRGEGDREITGVIQTDASINRGNSGGPLLDSAGRVIGVNTAIFSPTGTSAGLGFAVPVDTVRRVLPDLIEFGRYRRPWLGIDAAYAVDEGLADALDLPVDTGLLLVRVRDGSPLARAGVRGARGQAILGNRRVFLGGDLVTAVDGRPVTTRTDLRNWLEAERSVGDEVEVTVVRDGAERRLVVRLSERPQ